MKSCIQIIFVLLIFTLPTFAQKAELYAKGGDNGLYLEHKVVPKESFFSIGRTYNLLAKTIATYNKLDLTKGLQIDQKIRIPLIDTNFIQKGNSGTPVYYKVGENEGLMTVSNKYKNVSLANLRFWNNLSADNLKKDSKVIIGFLLSKSLPSITIAGKPKQEDQVVKTEDKPKPVVEEKEEDVATKEERKEEDKAMKKEEKKEEKQTEKVQEKKNEEKKNDSSTDKNVPAPVGSGYFQSHFDKQVRSIPVSKNETVTSGIFKTLSGWQDGKYYLLIDKIPPGTIVRIINPTNNKAVYAKVLGEMSGIRQNEGLNIRISNAAASALNIEEQDKFIVKVNY